MLSVLDSYTLDNPDEIAKEIANDFRKRRIEKNLTREQVSEKAGVAVRQYQKDSNRKALSHSRTLSYSNGIRLHLRDSSFFSEPKYSTMEELLQIRKNTNKKKVHK